MSEGGKRYAEQLVDAVREAQEKLRKHIKCPVTLEIAVGVEAAQKLKQEYISSIPHNGRTQEYINHIISTNKIPELMGLRVYVDDGIVSNWYEVRMKVKKGAFK